MNARCQRWLLMAVLAASPARAQTPEVVERAKASFKAGATAYGAGNYPAAIQALEAAYALTPLPAIAFSLAQAERRQYFVEHHPQHLQRAIELYRTYVAEAPTGKRRAEALDALSQLEPLARTSGETAPSEPERERQQPTRLMINTEVPDARLSLDGASPVPAPLISEVTPGKHTVRVEARGFYSSERELTAIASELVFAEVTLRERPHALRFTLPKSAEIYLDNTLLGHRGSQLTLRVPAGKHRVVVTQKGYRPWSRSFALARGGTTQVRVRLERTAQRTTALGLIIGAGAGVSATLLLSALAIQAENRAEDFLGRRRRGNVTSHELDEYEEAIRQRNRYRAGAAVSLTSSAGLLLTGVLLHEFDKPDAQELFGDSQTSARERRNAARRTAPRVTVAPLVTSDGLGAAFAGAF